MKKKVIFWVSFIAALLSIAVSFVSIKNINNKFDETTETPHKHNFSIVETVLTPTCFSSGEELHSCSCGELFMKRTPVVKHFVSNFECIYCNTPAPIVNFICDNYPPSYFDTYIPIVEGSLWSELDNFIINDHGYVLYEIRSGEYAFVRELNTDGNYVFVKNGVVGKTYYQLSYYGTEGYMTRDPSVGEFWITYLGDREMGYGYVPGAQVKLKFSSNQVWYDSSGNVYHGGDIVIMNRDFTFFSYDPTK